MDERGCSWIGSGGPHGREFAARCDEFGLPSPAPRRTSRFVEIGHWLCGWLAAPSAELPPAGSPRPRRDEKRRATRKGLSNRRHGGSCMSLRFSLPRTDRPGDAGRAWPAPRLVQPGSGWLSVVVSLTAAAFGWQVLRVWLAAGGSRAAAAGWLLFAVCYLALALAPWLRQTVGPQHWPARRR